MESLKFTSLIPCKSSSLIPVPTKLANHQAIEKLGFAPLWKRRCRRVGLRLRASVAGGSGGGAQDGASAVEDQQKDEKGAFLGAERDDSSAVLGFNLVPPNGKFSGFRFCLFIYKFFCFYTDSLRNLK